jgi:enterochelin esterase-like enzyme
MPGLPERKNQFYEETFMQHLRVLATCVFVVILCASCTQDESKPISAVRITLGDDAAAGIAALGLDVPVVGRAFFIVSRNNEDMPHLGTGVTGNPLWGVDVRDYKAGDTATIADGESTVSGYPYAALDELPAGDYYVQAFLNVYTRFERADGHVIEAHMNSGAFQDPFKAPGNAYSDVQQITLGEDGLLSLDLTIDNVIQPPQALAEGEVLQLGNYADTEWVKYVKIRSEKLSEFWGRDMYIGANILLPPGYDEHSDARYPVLYMQGHSSGLTPMPWAPNEWFRPGYEAEHVAVGPQLDGFYEAWTSGSLPKMVVITIRDANPFFDTSYSVNTPTVGPYGDAITEELMPHLESEFRIVVEPWGRVLAGRSTGGWEAAAMMVFYPDLFAGSFPWAPDPIDFRKLMQVNIYEFNNAFYNELEWIRTALPAQRETDGLVNYGVIDEHRYEQTVATKDRSGGQWAIWQALYSPVGEDGYPQPLWDATTGEIDPEVAKYWRENWDLSYIIERDWATLGPKLAGKLHFAVGRRDNYYLEQSVYLTEERMKSLQNPYPGATFQYGIGGRHSWIGHSPSDPDKQMRYAEFIGVVAGFIEDHAPGDADIKSWKY